MMTARNGSRPPRRWWDRLQAMIGQARVVVVGDAATYYTFLGDDVMDRENEGFSDPNKPLWLNLGYWKEARRYPDACAALALLLGETAGLGPGDKVLDAGFGFAEQDLLWLDRFDVGHIVGVNITPLHVRVARQRIAERGLEHRIDLRHGSATALPLPNDSVDKVLALECAFHFDTRERFFAEAFRVLRPGGCLALTDMLPLPGTRPFALRERLLRRRLGLPAANVYDRDVYAAKLAHAGFTNVRLVSIGHYVHPGITAYARARRRGASMADIQVNLSSQDVSQAKTVRWRRDGLEDYVLVAADKPARA